MVPLNHPASQANDAPNAPKMTADPGGKKRCSQWGERERYARLCELLWEIRYAHLPGATK
jgi:hypothetical protein